jgi:YggT family protein
VGIVCIALSVYWFFLIARVILSWVQAFGGRVPPSLDPVIRVVYDLTEPVLGFFRRFIPPIGMFDISILVVFIALSIVQRSLCA